MGDGRAEWAVGRSVLINVDPLPVLGGFGEGVNPGLVDVDPGRVPGQPKVVVHDVQYDDERLAARAHLYTDDDGTYRFWAITPTPYPIPDDGPVGEMLEAVGRSPMRASHLHFMVSHERCRTLVTHIFVRGDELLDSDSVFGVKESLIKDFHRQAVGTPTPDGRVVESTWSKVRFDIVLAPPATDNSGAGLPAEPLRAACGR